MAFSSLSESEPRSGSGSTLPPFVGVCDRNSSRGTQNRQPLLQGSSLLSSPGRADLLPFDQVGDDRRSSVSSSSESAGVSPSAYRWIVGSSPSGSPCTHPRVSKILIPSVTSTSPSA